MKISSGYLMVGSKLGAHFSQKDGSKTGVLAISVIHISNHIKVSIHCQEMFLASNVCKMCLGSRKYWGCHCWSQIGRPSVYLYIAKITAILVISHSFANHHTGLWNINKIVLLAVPGHLKTSIAIVIILSCCHTYFLILNVL